MEDAAEQAALAAMRELRAQGVSLAKIVAHVAQQHGFALNVMSVSRLTARP